MSFDLTGKSAIVFGGGSSGKGISNGQAICCAYAQSGADVLVVDRVEERAIDTVKMITAKGGRAKGIQADVSNAADVSAVVSECVNTFDKVSIVHNNVGLSLFGDPIEMSEEDWDTTMAVNVKSAFLSAKFALPIMLKQGSGCFVSTSSILSTVISEYSVFAYTASKAALDAFSKALAIQYADRGIRSNIVMPGLINSPQVREHAGFADEEAAAKEMAARDQRSPTKKMGDVWDIAWASVFLASDEAAYVNAHILPVDGGILAKQA